MAERDPIDGGYGQYLKARRADIGFLRIDEVIQTKTTLLYRKSKLGCKLADRFQAYTFE